MLRKWLNPIYLNPEYVRCLHETALSKPVSRYLVLDNFFNEDLLLQMISNHVDLQFREDLDRGSVKTNDLLPYDGAVKFADQGDFGAELFFCPAWHQYLAYLVSTKLREPGKTVVKLRYHRPEANGFWIHTDSTERSLVAIAYFNRNWLVSDGGMLQLWRVDEVIDPAAPEYSNVNPAARFDFLNCKRLRTRTPGGGWMKPPLDVAKDLVLIEQVLPSYNRLFVADFQYDRTYHSVTPSTGRTRLGFVEWLYSCLPIAIGLAQVFAGGMT